MKILISGEKIHERCAELGKEIGLFYGKDAPLTVITLMNGSMFFSSQLLLNISIPLYVDSFQASSYQHDRSTGKLTIRCDTKLPVRGRHVLLTDDIIDTGLSLKLSTEYFMKKGALSVRTCVLLDKKDCRRPEGLVHADWTGFTIPDYYVVGFGLDSEELYRNLPYIGVLDSESGPF